MLLYSIIDINVYFENKKEGKLSLWSTEKKRSRIRNGRTKRANWNLQNFLPRVRLQQEYNYLQGWFVDFYLFLIKIASELKGIYHTNTQIVPSSELNKKKKGLTWHETENHVITF
jgi:hypothetical protein